jgi:hypothetical protein
MNNNYFNYHYWEQVVLKRKLKKKECELINNAKCEYNMNRSIKNIHENVQSKGLYIPMLTVNNGNCLFHSLCYYNLADDIDSLKLAISNLMIFFKDKKKFLPNQEETVSELFTLYNDIEYVLDYNGKKLYKYTYDAMCIDILVDDGWKRINTQLMLSILSVALNIKFTIHHDNGHSTNICPCEKETTRSIYLAQIGECHYIPLDEISNENSETLSCPKYTDEINKFVAWGNKMKNKKNNYVQSSSSDDEYILEN